MNQPVSLESEENDRQIVSSLAAQHPLHAMVGRVHQRMGGEDRFFDWADLNEGAFYRLMFGLAPSAPQLAHNQGDVNLHVHPALQPTELDVIDGEFTESK